MGHRDDINERGGLFLIPVFAADSLVLSKLRWVDYDDDLSLDHLDSIYLRLLWSQGPRLHDLS